MTVLAPPEKSVQDATQARSLANAERNANWYVQLTRPLPVQDSHIRANE